MAQRKWRGNSVSANPDARDREGKTALDLADASNNLAAIAILSVTTKTSH
jgi:ankyrin repeat protein